MNVHPLGGLLGSAAGTHRAQRAGETDRAQQDAVHAQRQATAQTKAEAAAGIGSTDAEDQAPQERDADGRRPWEAPPAPPDQSPATPHDPDPPRPRDVHGERGQWLDLSG
jgi:hypothetical protein